MAASPRNRSAIKQTYKTRPSPRPSIPGLKKKNQKASNFNIQTRGNPTHLRRVEPHKERGPARRKILRANCQVNSRQTPLQYRAPNFPDFRARKLGSWRLFSRRRRRRPISRGRREFGDPPTGLYRLGSATRIGDSELCFAGREF